MNNLICINQVAKIFNVDKTTVYGYIKKDLIPKPSVVPIRSETTGCKAKKKIWVESEILACVDKIEAQKLPTQCKPVTNKSIKSKPLAKKTSLVERHSMAMGLMRAIR